jgi:hypothetical protein
VNTVAAVALPRGVVMMGFAVETPAGTTAVNRLALTTFPVALAVPKATVAGAAKFVPTKVTVVPMPPWVALNEVILGAAAREVSRCRALAGARRRNIQ